MNRALPLVCALLLSAPGMTRASVAWHDVLRQPDAWYASGEAHTIADDVLLFQTDSGGWPKNRDMTQPPPAEAKTKAFEEHADITLPTIDNNATWTQLRFLARVQTAQPDERYREAFDRGIDYLLKAQYDNGGWPQFYPLRPGYYTHITFNDDAMIGVLTVLRDVDGGKPPFAFVDDARRARCRVAVEKGIGCILRCQIKVGGALTVWCAQHDENTFEPVPARKYEHESLSGLESVGIVRFLMGIEKPSPEIVGAITGAVAWFERAKITGIRIDSPVAPDLPHGHDRIVVADPSAPPLWARFYEIDTNRPIFGGRDTIVRYSLAEVEPERRGGYRWYVDDPAKLLAKDFPKWAKRCMPAPFTIESSEKKLRGKFPDISRLSDELPAGVVAHEDITYREVSGHALALDLYAPDKGGPFPAVILVHGGGWDSGERQMERPFAKQLAALGYVAVPVSYRLGPAGRFPEALYDLKAAVRWLRLHAGEYAIDASHIGAIGASAGGQLVALLGATNDDSSLEGEAPAGPGIETGSPPRLGGSLALREPSSEVQAVVDIDGLADFTTAEMIDGQRVGPSAPTRFLGGSFADRAAVWHDASALFHVGPRSAPTLFVDSTAPTPLLPGRETMRDALHAAGVASEIVVIPDTPHEFWLFHPWFDEVLRDTDGFLRRQLHRAP